MNGGQLVQLPSRGKCGDSHVSIGPIKLETIRGVLTYEGDHKLAINKLIEEVTGQSIAHLPVGDRDYLYVTIRKILNDAPLSGTVECDCGKTLPYVLEFANIQVTQIKDDLTIPAEFKLPVSKELVKMYLFTVAMEIERVKYLELHQTADSPMKHRELGEDLPLFVKFALMLAPVMDPAVVCNWPLIIEEKITWLRNLDFKDFQAIMLFDLLFEIGPDVSTLVKCTCGLVLRVKIPLDTTFLGISLNNLLIKHRFLAKSTRSIGYKDFLEYTVKEMEAVVNKEIESRTKK